MLNGLREAVLAAENQVHRIVRIDHWGGCPLERANANVSRQQQIQEGSETMTNRNSPHQPVTPSTDEPGAGRSLKSRNHVHVETDSLFIDRLRFRWCRSWHTYVRGTTVAPALTVTRQHWCTLMPGFITVLSSFVIRLLIQLRSFWSAISPVYESLCN